MKIKHDWVLKTILVRQLEIVDTPFNWFPGDLSASDMNSLDEIGILLPLLVQAVNDSKYRLVDGFKRCSWLKSYTSNSGEDFQQTELSCLVIPASVSMQDVAKIRLETLHSDPKDLSGIHLCRVTNFFMKEGFLKEVIASQVFPRLGLISSVRLAGQLLELHDKLAAPRQQKKFKLPESMTRMGYEDLLPLLKFTNKDYSSVVSLAEKMEVRGKKWRNLLQVLEEVIRMRQSTAAEILSCSEFKKIMTDSNLQGPVRYRLLKQQLDILRYPELSDMRNRFDQNRKGLKLPQRMMLECDQYFENEELFLTLKIRSTDELREHLRNLSETLNSENRINAWNDLFAVLREE